MVDSSLITNRMLICFNLLPATYAHCSWYCADETLQARLAQLRSAAAQRTLSQWLLRRYGLNECTDFDFGSEAGESWEKALCLREPGWLQRLALLLGLLRCRSALRRRIGDDTLRRLGEEIGASAVRQALAVWPEPAFIAAQEQDISAGALVPRLLDSGARWLFGWIEPCGHAVTARTHFKFPRSIAEQPAIAVDDAARAAARAYLETYIVPVQPSCR